MAHRWRWPSGTPESLLASGAIDGSALFTSEAIGASRVSAKRALETGWRREASGERGAIRRVLDHLGESATGPPPTRIVGAWAGG